MLARQMDWIAPNHYDRASNRLIMSIHSWVIRTGHKTIVIDTCVGNDKCRPVMKNFHHLNTRYMENMTMQGVHPDEVDYVLCTHLHADHVGWNTRRVDGRWIPTFPNATVICSEAELSSLRACLADPAAPMDAREIWVDSILPLLEHGKLQTVPGEHQLSPEVSIQPAPGHTEGSIAVWVASDGQCAVACGDVCQHPLQVFYPELNSAFCEQPVIARDTRMALFSQCIQKNALLLPTHWGFPHYGRLGLIGDTFSIDWV